jgi:hypothetical protein
MKTYFGVAAVLAAFFLPHAGVGIVHGSPLDQLMLAFQGPAQRSAASTRTAATRASLTSRANSPVVTVSSTAPGQAGYIHYFVITGPDGEPESQIGIELPGDRIAWSFPELGVVISPFISSGALTAQGKSYDVQHLYGIRPFPDEESMRNLQQELAVRIAPWIADRVPHCDEERPPNQVCVSCLGFVLRVLYPSAAAALAALPALPADFRSARKNIYTTEDLLLYLTGVPVDAPQQARLARIELLAIPEALRDQLVRIAGVPEETPTAVVSQAPALKSPTAKPRGEAGLPKRVLTGRRS